MSNCKARILALDAPWQQIIFKRLERGRAGRFIGPGLAPNRLSALAVAHKFQRSVMGFFGAVIQRPFARLPLRFIRR